MSFGTATQGGGFGLQFRMTPWVRRLLIANGVVFLVALMGGRSVQLFMLEWLTLQPVESLTRPWGVLTYMFVHVDFWHVAMNMLVLFFFGPPLEDRWGSSGFIRFYLLAGLGGALLGFIFAAQATVLGASGAVFGVMFAFAWLWPEAPIYLMGVFPVKAKWLVGILFVFTFVSTLTGTGDGVAHFAHLGGILAGFLQLRFLPPGGSSSSGSGGVVRSSRKMAIVPREEPRAPAPSRRPDRSLRKRLMARARSRDDEGRPEEELLDEVDRILDKISESGMTSLTREEREVLDEVSRRRRTN
ncbi:MAG: rhomboid family intramembrane serine protease [Gemmatimonadales bacterium]|nr:MAG: rhomboid family intramembrane serine protease [Gemmatimonadales bacterium]